jgi:hypothetical protein
MRLRSRTIIMAGLALLLLAGGAAQAHNIKLFALAEGGQLRGEAYVPGGGKIKQGTVEVHGAGGALLAKTEVDGQGRFAMPMPQGNPPFKLVLKAGPGHRAEYVLSAADLGANAPKARVDEGVTVRSVVEGLGLIVALAGLAFYFKSLWEKRKRKQV